MYKQRFNKQAPLKFKHFSRHGYSLFAVLGKEVLIGVLSVATLTYAKAEGVSVKSMPAKADSVIGSDVKLDEVVVTGSRAPLTALQSAKIVSVITRDDINHAAVESVNDVLKLATGVDVRQRSGFGVQTDISINGGTFDQIQILLNGMPLSSPQTGHNAADFPVALADIERIEVLEGASARVFGSSAFSGAINIVTKVDHKNGERIALEGGSFGSFGIGTGVALGDSYKRIQFSGGIMRSDGGAENTDFTKRRLFSQGFWDLNKHLTLNFQGGFSSQDFGAGTFYGVKSKNQYEETYRALGSVSAEIKNLPHELLITPTVYGHVDDDHYQWIKGKTGAAWGENYHKTEVYGASLNVSFAWLLGKTALGADIRREHIISTIYGEPMDSADFKPIHGSDREYTHEGKRTNTSIFAEHNVILGGFTLSMGLMANRNTGLDNDFHLYPGIDFSYRPNDDWKFYASWNKALRVPTYTDLYAKNSAQVGDKKLKSERNSTFKVGTRYRHCGVEVVASAFYARCRNMIDWVYLTEQTGPYHALNIGKLDNMGASVEASLKPSELLRRPSYINKVTFGYAYIHQRHETAQQILRSLYALEYLRHKLTFGLDHQIYKSLTASWALRWQQRMNGYNPYAKLDCKVQWTKPTYSIYVKADNLTCHRYYDIAGVKQPGLWLMAGASIRFK